MSERVLDRTFARIFESPLVAGPFTVVWHAGEPMVLRPAWYARAFEIAAAHNRDGVVITHSFQTNGMLLDDEWCAFIRAHELRIGVSIDGPAFLHDRHRVTRKGTGTHRQALEGIARLRVHGIPFHVISVLTDDALDYPDELYAFYREHGVREVGFNVEEIEGPHTRSSLAGAQVETRFRRFLARFFALVAEEGDALHVRELAATMAAIAHGGGRDLISTQETTPFAIVAVDAAGNFSSFSPELLGLTDPRYRDFVLGNVETDAFVDAAQSPAFAAMRDAIAAGVDRCRDGCAYYGFCGGGAPVNKLAENGDFDSTETLFCRLNRKAMLDVVLDRILPAALPTA